jgi:hypothetical protein
MEFALKNPYFLTLRLLIAYVDCISGVFALCAAKPGVCPTAVSGVK